MQLIRSARLVSTPLAQRGAIVIAPVLLAWLMISAGRPATAQSGPVVFHSNLSVRTIVLKRRERPPPPSAPSYRGEYRDVGSAADTIGVGDEFTVYRDDGRPPAP